MRVQALRPKLPVQALDEGVVGRLAGTGEVERDIPLVRPEVEVAGNELAEVAREN